MKKALRVLPFSATANYRLRAQNGLCAVAKTAFSGGKMRFFALEGAPQGAHWKRAFFHFFFVFLLFFVVFFVVFTSFFGVFFVFFALFFAFSRVLCEKLGDSRVLPRGNSKKICGDACLVRSNSFPLFPCRFIMDDGFLSVAQEKFSTDWKSVVQGFRHSGRSSCDLSIGRMTGGLGEAYLRSLHGAQYRLFDHSHATCGLWTIYTSASKVSRPRLHSKPRSYDNGYKSILHST